MHADEVMISDLDLNNGNDRFSEVVEDSPSMEADVVGRNWTSFAHLTMMMMWRRGMMLPMMLMMMVMMMMMMLWRAISEVMMPIWRKQDYDGESGVDFE